MQPNVLLERIPAMVHSTIKVKDFNEMIKSNRGNASKQNTTQFAKITRTIKNETAVAARDICTEQPDSTPVQKQPIFKCTFNNLPATVVSKDQAISLTMRFSSPSSSCTNNNGGGGGTGRQRRSHYGIPEAALVFGVTCLPYLENLCQSAVHCRKSHQFNNIDFVFSALNAMNKSEFSLAYSFMYNHFKLYVQFFIVFCNVCAVRNDRVRLLNMVNDCERYPEHAEFLILVFETLVKCGLSPVNACRLMLKRIKDKSTKIIDALVAIILKSDWTMFSDYIENFTQKDYKYNYRTEILEQMAPAVLNNNQTQLKEVFFKCVQTVHCDELPRLLCCSPSLMQCLDLMAATSGQVEH